jgi:U2 small nuclear ribonucleoprotein A'
MERSPSRPQTLTRHNQDQECIDFTDNAIQTLSNFPLSPRLQTLLCAQNRISSISESTPKSVPNLHTLVLTKNHFSELSDLDPLQGFSKLTYLSLIGNPVASKEVSKRRVVG